MLPCSLISKQQLLLGNIFYKGKLVKRKSGKGGVGLPTDPFRDGHEGFWIFLKVVFQLEYQKVLVISFEDLQKLH